MADFDPGEPGVWTMRLPNGRAITYKLTEEERFEALCIQAKLDNAKGAERKLENIYTQAAIEQAIKDERERCAKIVQGHFLLGSTGLAEKIRSGT